MKPKRRFISRIWTHPLLWILMLMPIALVGHWLALYWPSADNLMNMSSDFSHDHGSLIVHHTYATSTKTGNSDQGTSRNFHINLETGSVKSGSSEEAEMLARGSTLRVSRRGNAPESTDDEDGNALWRFSVTDFRKRDYQVLLPGGTSYPTIVNDTYIVAANSQKLIALKFEEKNPIPIEFDVPSGDGVLLFPNGKQFQFLDGLQPAPTVYLFELRDDGIHKKGSWLRSQYRGMYRMKDQEVVMLFKPDGKIETRNVLTDELIPIAIDSSIDLSVMQWGLDSNTNTVWVKSGAQKMNFEFGTWRRIPNAGLDTYWLHARSHGRSIFASQDMQTMVCVDDTLGERVWERKELFPEFKLGLAMSTLGEDRILVYSLTEFGFLILDRETGATIAKHQPLWGIGYLLFAWVAFTSLWWIGWFARSVADGGWAWLDCSCFLVINMAAVAGRILLSGEPTSETRIELRICQGICAAGVTLTCLWIVFGKTRWTLKILPPIAWVAFVCAVVMAVFGLRSWAVGATVMTLSVLFLWMLLAAWVMRWTGIRLKEPTNGDMALREVATGKSRFPLRDIFLLTAVVAVLFSVLRFAPLPKANAFDLGFIEGLVNCLLMAMNVMVVSWCALSRRAIWVRLPMWLGSPLICATIGVLYSAWLHQSKNFEWIAAYHGVVQLTAAVTVFFLLHAYRWRGLRFAS
jgi:hypothetical protein